MTAAVVEQQQPVRCIRRAGSLWSLCPCEPCRTLRGRMYKLARNDRYRRVSPDAAWAVIDRWIERGWTGQAMASAVGVAQRTMEGALVELNTTGRRRRFGPTTSRRIVEARDARPTAGLVGALGSTRRLQALSVQGFGLRLLSKETGIPPSSLSGLRSGRLRRVHATRANAITDAYRRLAGRYGGDGQAMAYARGLGWPAAVAWKDPDDPAEEPTGWDYSRPEGVWRTLAVEDIAWVLEHDPLVTAQEIADRFEVTRDAVQQSLRRAGRRDLLAQLARNAELAA